MVATWIFTILFFLIFLAMFIWAVIKDPDISFAGLFGGIGLVVTGMILWNLIDPIRKDPTPLDVYRGKTTLKVTYVDSLAVDSTVVWKPEFVEK